MEIDALHGTYLSLLASTILFSPSLLFYANVDAKFIALMLLAGILHFFVARLCFYHAIERIGANLSAPLSATRIFFATIFGLLIGEAITPKILLMGILIFAGILLLSKPEGKADTVGITLGLLTGFFSAASSLVVKLGMTEIYNPLFGAFLGFAISTILLTPFAAKNIDLRMGKWYMLAGVFVGLGHLVRYVTLSYLPVAVVEPITSTYPLFTILLSYLFMRESEVFSKDVILGAIFIVAGVNVYFI